MAEETNQSPSSNQNISLTLRNQEMTGQGLPRYEGPESPFVGVGRTVETGHQRLN